MDVAGPSQHQIGAKTLATPLVTAPYAKAHLRLLAAFKALRTAVEDNAGARLPEMVAGLDAARRWAWFVGLAVDRFECWADSVKPGSLRSWVRTQLPPLDVLMVWHAYMLNPRWYAEDCERLPLMKTLKGLGDRLLPAVIVAGDPATYQPTRERRMSWLADTGTHWDPLEASRDMTHRRVTCPKCAQDIETRRRWTHTSIYA